MPKKPTKRELVHTIAKLGSLNMTMLSIFRDDRNPMRGDKMEVVARKHDELSQWAVNHFPAEWMNDKGVCFTPLKPRGKDTPK